MKKYCERCGAKYVEGTQQPWVCSGCGHLTFEDSHPCVDLLLFDQDGRALITKRAREPNRGKFDLPGGFVNLGETFEQAREREIREELGLAPGDYDEPRYIGSHVDDYAFGRETKTVLVAVYTARLRPGCEVTVDEHEISAVEYVAQGAVDDFAYSQSGYPGAIRAGYALLFGTRAA